MDNPLTKKTFSTPPQNQSFLSPQIFSGDTALSTQAHTKGQGSRGYKRVFHFSTVLITTITYVYRN